MTDYSNAPAEFVHGPSINCGFCDRHMGYIFLKADKLDEAQEQSITLMKLAAIAMYSDCFAFRNHKIEDKK